MRSHLTDQLKAVANAEFQAYSWQLENFGIPSDNVQEATESLQTALSSKFKATEVEYFRNWVELEDEPEHRTRENLLLSLASRLELRRLNIYAIGEHSRREVVNSVASPYHRAAPYNLTVQLEFIQYEPAIPTLASAWEIIQEADCSNLGLVLDA